MNRLNVFNIYLYCKLSNASYSITVIMATFILLSLHFGITSCETNQKSDDDSVTAGTSTGCLKCHASSNGGTEECSYLSTKLILVQVIFRHGDRTPVFSYPNDPNKRGNSSTARLFKRKGLLTKRGKVEAYELGLFLNTRYKEFLTGFWIPEDVLVQSSEVDRAIMTAETVLAGLFPPTCSHEDEEAGHCEGRWSSEIPWQPIPVFVIPKRWDNKIRFQFERCPAFVEELNEVLSCRMFREFADRHQHVFDHVKSHTGLEEVNFKNIHKVYDTLYIQSLYNLQQPEWVKKVYPEPMKTIYELGFQVLSANEKMMKLNGGPLLKKVVDNMRKARERAIPLCPASEMKRAKNRPKKLFLYSGHDTTISAILAILGVFDTHQPPYASAVMVELHHAILNENDDDDDIGTVKKDASAFHKFIVKVFYRNNTNQTEPLEMIIPGCGNPCHLDKLEMVVRDLLITRTEWELQCQSTRGILSWLLTPFITLFRIIFKILYILCSPIVWLFSGGEAAQRDCSRCGCGLRK